LQREQSATFAEGYCMASLITKLLEQLPACFQGRLSLRKATKLGAEAPNQTPRPGADEAGRIWRARERRLYPPARLGVPAVLEPKAF
jgi:hypothetical protein